MAKLTPQELAPQRPVFRLRGQAFALKCPMDFSIVSWLALSRDVSAFLADPTEDGIHVVMQQIFVNAPPTMQDAEPGEAYLAFQASLAKDEGDAPAEGTTQHDFIIPAGLLASQFGAGIWHWLSECPMPVFMASLELLGPVQAWDTLRETRAITLGGGRLKKHDAQRAFSELERQAGKLRQPAEKGAPVTMNEMAARLSLLGANIEIIK